MQNLLDDPAFASLKERQWVFSWTLPFDSVKYDRTPGRVEAFEKESNWVRLSGGEKLSENEFPGTIHKYFIDVDGHEIPADTLRLFNGRASGKVIAKVRFEMVPNRPCNIRFDARTWYVKDSHFNAVLSTKYASAEPGKSYSLLIQNTNTNDKLLCSSMRVLITTADAKAVSTVAASCDGVVDL